MLGLALRALLPAAASLVAAGVGLVWIVTVLESVERRADEGPA